MRYLLDTNIVSSLIRDPHGEVTGRIELAGAENVCTSIVVAAELRFGAARRGSARLTAQMEAVLAALEVLPLESPTDEVYGGLRAEIERVGQPIGANDLLIASHALALGLTIVTDNEREFGRIPMLPVENWLRAAR